MKFLRYLTRFCLSLSVLAPCLKAEDSAVLNVWHHKALGIRFEYYSDEWKVIPPRPPAILALNASGIDEYGVEYSTYLYIRVLDGDPGTKMSQKDKDLVKKQWTDTGVELRDSEESVPFACTTAYFRWGLRKQGETTHRIDEYVVKLDKKIVFVTAESLWLVRLIGNSPKPSYHGKYPDWQNSLYMLRFKGCHPVRDKENKDWGIENVLTFQPIEGWHMVGQSETHSALVSEDWMLDFVVLTKPWNAEWGSGVDDKQSDSSQQKLREYIDKYCQKTEGYSPIKHGIKQGTTTIGDIKFKWESGTNPNVNPRTKHKVFYGKVGEKLVIIDCRDWETADIHKPIPGEALLKNIGWK